MGVEEFSNEFDVMVNSYRRFKGFDDQEQLDSVEFSEYEKSVYLTKAQEEIVVSAYNGKNQAGDSFEKTEELRRYLSALVAEARLQPIANSSGMTLGIASNSKFFTLPEDLWFITYESVNVTNNNCPGKNTLKVFPVRQDEYQNIKDNPFRGANNRRALRLDLSEGNVEIVSKLGVTEYYIRYIKKLKPIVLVKLPGELTIDGVGEITDCELHEALHRRVLERAVMMALQSKGGNKIGEDRKD